MSQNIPATQGWVKLPNAILDDLSLAPLSVRIYAKIVQYTGSNGSCWPSQEALASDMGVTIRTIKRSVAELLDRGHISVCRHRGTNQRSNTYTMTRGQECPHQGGRGQPCPQGGDADVPKVGTQMSPQRTRTIELEPLKEREPSLGVILDDVFGTLPRFEAPFNIRWRPPDDLKQRQAEVVRVMTAWHQHIGPVRTLTSNAGANICYRLADWTADELVQAVVGYAKATAKWRGNGRKAKTPAAFFANDDDIQNYVVQGADNVPVDQLPKLMQILIDKEFPSVHQHREALTKINAQVDDGQRSGSDVMNAINESNGNMEQLIEKLTKVKRI